MRCCAGPGLRTWLRTVARLAGYAELVLPTARTAYATVLLTALAEYS